MHRTVAAVARAILPEHLLLPGRLAITFNAVLPSRYDGMALVSTTVPVPDFLPEGALNFTIFVSTTSSGVGIPIVDVEDPWLSSQAEYLNPTARGALHAQGSTYTFPLG